MCKRTITAADRRIRAKLLNPGKRQNNTSSRNFVISPAATLGEKMENDRLAQVFSRLK